jgi:hypothetical protein
MQKGKMKKRLFFTCHSLICELRVLRNNSKNCQRMASISSLPGYAAAGIGLDDAGYLPPSYMNVSNIDKFITPTTECVAAAAPSNAHFECDNHGYIITFDKRLDNSSDEIFSFLKTHLSRPPKLMLRLFSEHRMFTGLTSGAKNSFSEKMITDYSFSIDFSKYVSSWDKMCSVNKCIYI